MPVINGVYLKDFPALPGAVADANIIPIAISGNQIAYRTTVSGIVTDARVTSKLLTGLSVTGGTISATDSILSAFGKVQNQINGKQDTITLTTIGTSGAATFIANTLNIPNYADGGVLSLSAIGATPNANAATITGTVLNLQPASSSFGGVVTTGTQTFAGVKTFASVNVGGRIAATGNLSGDIATFENTASSGFGLKVQGATGSNYAFQVNDYLGTNLFNVLGNGNVSLTSLTNGLIKSTSGVLSNASSADLNTAGVVLTTTDQSIAGVKTFTGNINATAFIPSGATVPTNGMYLSAANTLDFATNSLNRLSISLSGAATFSGNIGVGGGTPSIFTAYSVASFGSLSTTNNGITIASTTAGSGLIEFADGVTGNQAYRGYIQYNHSTDQFSFATAGSDRLTIASTGAATFSSTITTAAPSGGTAKPFKIGNVATVTPTSQNRTIEIEIDGTTYYLTAKTTND
jgi:hypothetical protein